MVISLLPGRYVSVSAAPLRQPLCPLERLPVAALAAFLSVASLAGCGSSGGGGSDDDRPEEQTATQTVEGVALGGTRSGQTELLVGYTVCVDLNRSGECGDLEEGEGPDGLEEEPAVKTNEDGEFTLTIEHDGDLARYPLVAEPWPSSNDPGRAIPDGPFLGVAPNTDKEAYTLSTWLDEPEDPETEAVPAVISPLTTLVQEKVYYTNRDVGHLEQRVATALGLAPDRKLNVDYREKKYSDLRGSGAGHRNIVGELDRLWQDLNRQLEQESGDLRRWADPGEDGNPGARRNFLAARAFYFSGLVAEGRVSDVLDETGSEDFDNEVPPSDLDLDIGRALRDIDREGRARELLRRGSVGDTDREPRDLEPKKYFFLTVAGTKVDEQAVRWRAIEFLNENGITAYSTWAEPKSLEGVSRRDDIPTNGEVQLPRKEVARGVAACELDRPLQYELQGGGPDVEWPIYRLVGQNRWKLHALGQDALTEGEEEFSGFGLSSRFYRGGFSCRAEGPGALEDGDLQDHLAWSGQDDLWRLKEEDIESPPGGEQDRLWRSAESLVEDLPTLAVDTAEDGAADQGAWNFLTAETYQQSKRRGLVRFEGGHQPGVYRYRTVGHGGQEDAGTLIYIDATPSGDPYGRLLRVAGGPQEPSGPCGDNVDWCVLARDYLLRGTGNEDLWMLNGDAASDLIDDHFP